MDTAYIQNCVITYEVIRFISTPQHALIPGTSDARTGSLIDRILAHGYVEWDRV